LAIVSTSGSSGMASCKYRAAGAMRWSAGDAAKESP
jgi:hypothetical protein